MEAQKDWMAFFERSEKRRQVRQQLIRELATDERVQELLLALDALSEAHPSAFRWPDGSVELAVPISVIAWQLRRSEGTVKSYIDLASSTPYLNVTPSKHRSHKYLVCWLAIVDRDPGRETHAGGCRNARSAPAHVHGRGSTDESSGGQLPPPRGSTRGPTRGSKGGQPGGQLAPSLTPSQPGLEDRSFKNLISKIPGLKTSPGDQPGGQLTPSIGIPPGPPGSASHPRGSHLWWRWWKEMIARRDLRNAADVEELYALGVASGLYPASEVHRLRVFAQAVTDVRRSQTPGALFRENVAWRRWYATCEAEDAALLMIQSLDSDLAGDRSQRWHDDSADHPDDDQARELAKSQLTAWAAARPG